MAKHCAVIGVLQVFLLILFGPATAQPIEDLEGLNRQVVELYKAKKYREALPLAERYAAGAKERYGPHSPHYAIGAANLARLMHLNGRLSEAEALYRQALASDEKTYGQDHPKVAERAEGLGQVLRAADKLSEAAALYLRALAIREKASGPEDAKVLALLGSLAEVYRAQGRYHEAESFYQRVLADAEKTQGQDQARLGVALNELAVLYEKQARYDEALVLYSRALGIAQKLYGPDHPNVAAAIGGIAAVYEFKGRYDEAEPLYRQALTIVEKALGPEHPRVRTYLNNLGLLLVKQGRYAEAEPLYQRALSLAEKAFGPEHSYVGALLHNLASLYKDQGRFAEAEPLFRRALAVKEKADGAEHPNVATSLNSLGQLYSEQRRDSEAVPLLERALTINEKALGPDHPHVRTVLNNLASSRHQQRRYKDAELLYRRALALEERLSGPNHPDVAFMVNNLGVLFADQRRFADAEAHYARALAIREKSLGSEHQLVGIMLSNLGVVRAAQSDWKTAVSHWRRSAELFIRRSRRGTETGGVVFAGQIKNDIENQSHLLRALVKAAHRLSFVEKPQAKQLMDETFRMAQWALSSAAASSLAQMATRQAKSNGALASLVRERQDLVAEWQARDKALIAARSSPPDKRSDQAVSMLLSRLAAIDARIGEIDGEFAKDFPDFSDLSNPEPLSLDQVKVQLRDDEALFLVIGTQLVDPMPEESFVWIVTKTNSRWVHLPISNRTLANHVFALRCGLDAGAWEGDGAGRCIDALKTRYSADDARAGKLLPFDLSRAHDLYIALFGQVEDLIRDKHLLIVPSGPLTSLPLQVLVTEKSTVAVPHDVADYANAAWLAKRQAITVLPSVASLKALRQFAKTSRATEPFIGFGNPLLTGPDGIDRRAWERQSCSAHGVPVQIASRRVRSTISKFFRSGLANVEEVRAQYPLPETADELCAVAQMSGAGKDFVYLGQKATEATIKALSANGTLERARIVHFATHGLLAGETEVLAAARAEPALILTPPQKATTEDDGLLTASEIAQLKLDADWVVLSACNTAAGESNKPGAEALSGLARAFFYAGTRALLVSHWAVNSEATVQLITKAFDELKTNPKIGRAESLRRSMLALIRRTDGYAHPANWAPFVVVGEGAAI